MKVKAKIEITYTVDKDNYESHCDELQYNEVVEQDTQYLKELFHDNPISESVETKIEFEQIKTI